MSERESDELNARLNARPDHAPGTDEYGDALEGRTPEEDDELAAEQATGYGDVLANDLEQLD